MIQAISWWSVAEMTRQLHVYVAATLLVSVSACPPECRCLDHDSIVNCHHADVDRLPSPLPPSAIVVDADRNRISALHNDSLQSALRFLLLLLLVSITLFVPV